jgi:hypothetical protein
MTVGAYWGGIWRPTTSRGKSCLSPSLTSSGVMPGQRTIPDAMRLRPQQDSNLRSRLRRALILTPVTRGNQRKPVVLGCMWGAGRLFRARRPLRPEPAAPLGVWPSAQLARCAGGSRMVI